VRFARVTFGHHDRRVLCSDLGTLFPNVRGDIGRIAGCVTFVNAVGMRAAILYMCMYRLVSSCEMETVDQVQVPHF
jgi:hypothetical protein